MESGGSVGHRAGRIAYLSRATTVIGAVFHSLPSRDSDERLRVFRPSAGYGSSHPVLTDVYYVVSQGNPETKQVTNSLIKRGKELHELDRMYLNPNQIVFVEPVGPNAKVAQLIAEQKKQ